MKRGVIGGALWVVAGAAIGVLVWRDLTTPRSAPVHADAGLPPDAGSPPLDAAVDGPSDAVVDAIEAPIDAPVDAMADDAPPLAPLYTIDEALDDVLSGPLTFIGTGDWYGLFSIHACAYRNKRVIVVNEYCTVKETPAIGLDVVSPSRGRIHVYAEAGEAISTAARADYLSFRMEVEPPSADPPSLSFTYAQLRAWDEARAGANPAVCFVGTDGTGCLREPAAAQVDDWHSVGAAFVAEPPPRWFQLAKSLHARAVRDRGR